MFKAPHYTGILPSQIKGGIMAAIEHVDDENRIKNTFMSVVSHETQTPLAIIKESLALVLDEIPGPLSETQARLIRIAQENAERLSLLISDMSDWVNLQSGKMSLEYADFNLMFLMKHELERAKELAEKKNIEVYLLFDGPQHAYCVAGDALKLEKIFARILKNSLGYTDPKGHVTIDIQEQDCYFRGLITDSGPGISPEDLAKLFSPMQQFHRTYRPGSQGIGMSLALCKKWMMLHGGDIDICSRVGEGTEIAVTLPKQVTYRKGLMA